MASPVDDQFAALYRTLEIQTSIINLLELLISSHIQTAEDKIRQALSGLSTMDVDFEQSLPQGVFVSEVKNLTDTITPEMIADMQQIQSQADILHEAYHARTVYSYFICDSLILTIYGTAERYFLNIADQCQMDFNKKVSPSDLKDQGIVSAINYLEKVIEVNPVKQHREWELFFRWNKVRNALAHNHGVCRKADRIAVSQFVALNTNGFLLLTFDHCRRFIEDTSKFTKVLEDTITQRYTAS